jgi:ketosteroid isomerase-like protein
MSQENVEVVRRMYELWNRGEFDAAVEMLDQHVVWNAYVHLPDSRTRHGAGEVQQWAGEFAEAWGEIQVHIEGLEEVRHDMVLALVRMMGRGRGSGAAVESGVDGHVWTVCDGKVAAVRMYQGAEEALEAVGLREQAMSHDDLATTFRRAMEAYGRGDYEAAMRDFDPAIEWSVDLSVTPDATTYHGHQGVKRFWEAWAEAISDMKLEIEECRGIGQDRVLAIVRSRGTGAGSGVPVASPRYAEIADFRDGRVVRVRLYGGVAAALEAAGLQE